MLWLALYTVLILSNPSSLNIYHGLLPFLVQAINFIFFFLLSFVL